MTAIFAIVKRLLASDKISFILTALVVLCATSSGEVVLSNGNYTWLLAVLTPSPAISPPAHAFFDPRSGVIP